MFEIADYIVHRDSCQCWPITRENLQLIMAGKMPAPSGLDFYHHNIRGLGKVRWTVINGTPSGLDFWEFLRAA